MRVSLCQTWRLHCPLCRLPSKLAIKWQKMRRITGYMSKANAMTAALTERPWSLPLPEARQVYHQNAKNSKSSPGYSRKAGQYSRLFSSLQSNMVSTYLRCPGTIMTVLITCSRCGWIGSNCYMGLQFDRLNRCRKCQPPPKVRKLKKQKIDWEKERDDQTID